MIKLFLRISVWLSAFLLLSGCSGGDKEQKERDLLHIKSKEGIHAKKVILILADSLMYQAIDSGIAQNKLPTFKFLIDNGQYYKDIVSSFPTMSVTIDSSLITGSYPDQHHVPGLSWYSSVKQEIINYGTGPMEILGEGIGDVLRDGLIHLNSRDLNPDMPTIFEQLNKKRLKTGSINGLIYRGPVKHMLSIPRWLSGTVALPEAIAVKGPDYLAFGSFSNPLKGSKQLPDSLANRMGFNNEFAVDTAEYLIHSNKLPDFLYVYLPDLDQELHKRGPSSMKGIMKLDRQLHDLLQAFGSPEDALSKATIMIIGDSGMSQLHPAGKQPVIHLTDVLSGYNSLRPGARVTGNTELVFAVNETMAYIYKLHTKTSLRQLASELRKDARIDIIAWKEDGWINVTEPGASKVFQYKSGGSVVDQYDQAWTFREDGAMPLDMHVEPSDGTLHYRIYPDVLRRLYGALASHTGEFLVVTAKEGYELKGHSSPTHIGGGGHGSLHRTESLIPLIISGTEEKLASRRVVDMKAYIERLLQN